MVFCLPMRWPVLLALVWCGCTDADYAHTHFRCDDGLSCPPGFSCVAFRCQPDSGGADGAITDAGAGTDLAGPPVCGKASVLKDNFDDNMIHAIWTVDVGGNNVMVQAIGGQAQVTLPSGSPAHGTFVSARRYDLTGSQFFIEMNQIVSTSTHARVFVQAKGDDANLLRIWEEAGTLWFAHVQAGSPLMPSSIPYSISTHRWWQLREQGGVFYFETSDNGVMFTTQASIPTPSFAGAIVIEFGAEAYQPESSPGLVQFDNVNGGGAPPAGDCPP